MKRIISLILLVALAASLTSCRLVSKEYLSSTSETETVENPSEIEFSSDAASNKESKTSNKTSSKANNPTNKKKSSTEKTVKPSLSESAEVKVEKTVKTDREIDEPVKNGTIDNVEFTSNHKIISASDYYQYSTLCGAEKTVYEKIVNAVSNSNSIVDTKNLGISEDDAISAFQKVIADYPQFFYVSRSCILAYGMKNSSIRAIILLYTDGTVTDEFDQNLQLITSADRDVINSEIDELNSVVKSVVAKISDKFDEVVKEKIIHDYIIKNVSYDYETAENFTNDITVPHAFDIYGAAVENSAVCEGYSKLFQYLCYTVGINSTQVIGTASGGNHMWNAVCIDGSWYMIDLTWDDNSDGVYYSYFNLTKEKMSKTHTNDLKTLSVPSCDSTENSFACAFAVGIKNVNSLPENYEKPIERIINSGDNRIYIYFEDSAVVGITKANRQYYLKYINRYILNDTSSIAVFLSDKGISLSSAVYSDTEYFYIIEK